MPRIVVLNVKLLGALHWSQGRQVRMEDGSGAQEEPSLVGLRAQGLSRGGGGRTERMSLVQVSKCAAREADPPPPVRQGHLTASVKSHVASGIRFQSQRVKAENTYGQSYPR